MLGFGAIAKRALGKVPALTASSLIANSGTFVLTGQEALFSASVPLDVGAFTLSGQAAVSTISVPAGVGTFTLTGQTAALAAVFSILCEPTPTGVPTQWAKAALGKIAIGQGRLRGSENTFKVEGQNTLAAFSIGAGAGTFNLTGQDARLVEGAVLTADVASFAINGQAAVFAVTMPLAAGTYTISGAAVELARRSPKLRRFPRVGSTTVSARSRGAGVKVRAYGG